jgi:hypothetical protein
MKYVLTILFDADDAVDKSNQVEEALAAFHSLHDHTLEESDER